MTLLEHLNTVSIERGFKSFSEVLEYPELHVIDIIETAGRDYARECVVSSLEKASENGRTTCSCTIWNCEGESIKKESITNENNIVLL